MKDLQRIFAYLGPYRKDLALGAFLVVVESSFEMVIPVLMAGLIDTGVANGDVAYILHKGIQMGMCALLALLTGLLYARFAARARYSENCLASSPVNPCSISCSSARQHACHSAQAARPFGVRLTSSARRSA